jgi:hypothetical protein
MSSCFDLPQGLLAKRDVGTHLDGGCTANEDPSPGRTVPSAHTLGLLLCPCPEANNFETWSLGLAVHHALAFGPPAHLNAILYWAARLKVSVDVRCRAAGIYLSNQWAKKPLLLRDLLNELL